MSRKRSWFLTSIITLLVFIVFQFLKIAKFTAILGIGGAISGGLTAILILIISKRAKINGERKPSYSMPNSSLLIWSLIIIFILGALAEIIKIISMR